MTIRTGDAILFSSNTPTSFLLRTFVSSDWSHAGIAVRFTQHENEHGTLEHRVSLNDEGKLYILETNTGVRYDAISGTRLVGVGFSDADWVFAKYNSIAIRRLHDVFRTPELADLTMNFAQQNLGNTFPSSSLPFLGVWLGVPLADKNSDNTEMFCSEVMAHYYQHVIGQQYTTLTGSPYDGKLTTLFGSSAPKTHDMYTPGHFAQERTPYASIFSGLEEVVHTQHADLWYVIIQPFLIIAVIALLIWMLLPGVICAY